MSEENKTARSIIRVTGGAWVAAAGHGQLAQVGERTPSAMPVESQFYGQPQWPAAREIFSQRLPRWGRYDAYTQCGLACAALALRDAGWGETPARRPAGIAVASALDCCETDLAFYRTALEEGGSLASPNLFTYTIPVSMPGECAILFGLAGPSVCLGEEGDWGMSALRCALDLLADGQADAMLAGWVDCFSDPLLPANARQGAVFVVLEREPANQADAAGGIQLTLTETGAIQAGDGRPIESLLDLFAPELHRDSMRRRPR